MAKTYKVTIAGEEYELRFTRKERRHLERQTKLGLREVLFSNVEDNQDALVWAGLQDDELSFDQVQKLIDAEEETNGVDGVIRVWNVARRAVLESELAGKFTAKQIDKLVPPVDPTGPQAAVVPS
jgi:hypothetical protein